MALHSVLLMLGLIAYAGGNEVLIPPKDTVVLVGQNATLTCVVNILDHETENLEWKEYITSSAGATIFNSLADEQINNPEKFSIQGEYNLVVKNPQVADGGMYACKLSRTESVPNVADLIVIEKPNIMVNTMREGQNATGRCVTNFGSQPLADLAASETPHMRLRLGGQLVESGEETVVVTADDNEKANSHISALLAYEVYTIVDASQDKKNLTCEVFTTDPEVIISSNVTLDVKYTVRNLHFDPQLDVYEVGDVITCLADGNPTPTVGWTPPRPENINGDKLKLTQDMIGHDQNWTCQAQNSVDDVLVIKGSIHFQVVEPKNPSGGGADRVGASLATALIIFAIMNLLR